MTVTIDGILADWSASDRLERPETLVAGYALYGRFEDGAFVLALESALVIGPGTTFWLNTDTDTATGHQIWGWAGGAELNVDIGADGVARLYAGAAGETFVAEIEHAFSADGKVLEMRLPQALIGSTGGALAVYADVNDAVFLPASYSSGGYVVVQPPPSSFDGLLGEWTEAERLDTQTAPVEGYALYGRIEAERFVIALESVQPIGPGTTFWINTDADVATGHQIWGWAGGAEFNVNIGADGIARLYRGGAGEIFVAEIDHAIAPGGTGIEFALPKSVLGAQSIAVLADVNDSVFLPANYGFGGYTLAPSATSAFDGLLTEWTAAQRLETPTTHVEGYELYGTVREGAYVIALKSAVEIGPNTTFWIDTDGDVSSGHLVWGWAVGAEFNVNFGIDGKARLYTGDAGQTFVSELDFAIGPDGRTLELAVPKALLGANVNTIRLMADVNDAVHLPVDYTRPAYVLTDPGSVPPTEAGGYKIAIVYSETTAGAYWSEMAYAQLVMAAQSQAMSAGIPFDLIGEADLTDLAKLSQYSALVFPSFRNAPANFADIAATLNKLVYQHDVPIITAGDFMTNAADGAGLSANPYERMQTLLGLTRSGGESGVAVDLVAAGVNDVTAGYAGGAIRTYSNAATSYFSTTVEGAGTVFARQVVNGVGHDAVISTTTGGRNVHFATDGMLADNNLLGKALDWATQTSPGPKISLAMSRDTAIVASRNDMDQSQETHDVDTGIYDAMLPILEQWKAQYNFVGSYYINVGLYAPDQDTNWFISSPYYQRLLAMGNEIGSHSYTHPFDTNLLLPDVVTQEILEDRIAGYAAMLDNPSACFCPYCMREDADQAVIDALAQMSVAQINATLQAALAASDPMALDPVAKAILEASFRFQFQASRHVIEDKLGITVSGAAVPGMPETLETARQIIQYYDYLTGGASMFGAGYPGAFGYLTPADADKVYIAPNMSFDFTLMGWLGLNPDQAKAKWVAEFNELTINADLPIVVWPWHDYGPTAWDVDGTGSSNYTLSMFTAFLDVAYAKGAEFVTLADLAARISAFEKTDLSYKVDGDTITVTAAPQSGTLGTFALNLDDLGTQKIASVTNWYAYDADSVFLDADGGAFEIKLGTTQLDVTRISAIGARIQLLSLSGDGVDLGFRMYGEGLVTVDLNLIAGTDFVVTGAQVVERAGDVMTLRLDGLKTHTVALERIETVNHAPTDIVASGLVAIPELTLDRIKVADLSVIDPDTRPELRNNTVTVSDARFEIDPTDGALYRKAGIAFDFETEPAVTVTLTATDGALVFSKPLTIAVANVNEAPTDIVVANLLAVPEIAAGRFKVADLSVTDPDLVANFRNNTVTVSDDRFEIDPVDGALYKKAGIVFDVETEPAVTVILSATDGDLAVSRTLTIGIADINEAPTDIVVTNLVAVQEAATGRIKVAELSVTDPDLAADLRNNVVTVSDSRFEIDPTDGALYKKAGVALDFETAQTIELTLTAGDGSLSFSKPLTIAVANVNEAPTDIVVTDLVAVPEQSTARAKIANLSVTDPDTVAAFRNNVVTVSDSRFEIDPIDGALYKKAGIALDFGTTPTIDLTLTAADGALSFSKAVTVAVGNVNKAPTDIVVTNLVAVPEVSTARVKVANLSVTDPDTVPAFRNNTVTISDSRFEIDPTDGALYKKAGIALDFETTPAINLTLTASDGALSFSKPLTVAVANINEAPTDIVVTNLVAVPEVSTARVKVANLAVADPDTVAAFRNNKVTVSDSRFEIDPTNGALYKKAGLALDFETTPTINLTLTAADGALTVSKALTVAVANVNEAPTDIVVTNLVAVPEVSTARVKVANLSVTDPDTVAAFRNNKVTVSDSRFEIDPANGALYKKAGIALDFETTPTINLTLTAADGTLTVSKALTVAVANVNEAPTGAVTLTGNAIENQTLTASAAALRDPDGLGAFSYQWQRETASGFVNIAGATRASYTLAAADADTRVRVMVSYVDGGGTRESVASAPSARIVDVLPVLALKPLTEDLARNILPRELVSAAVAASGFTITAISVSSGKLAQNTDGTWIFVPLPNDDTAVTFNYTMTTPTGTKIGSATLDLVDMTDIVGNTAANTLAARATADQYHGGGGNDVIRAGAGDDIIFGEAGNDIAYGDTGMDVFVATDKDGDDFYYGGSGRDTIDFTRLATDMNINLTTGKAVGSRTGTDTLDSIEDVIGGRGNDTIIGSSVLNQLWGGPGNDRLEGMGGRDNLTGDGGADVFVFRDVAHSGPSAAERDLITDFTRGQDKIDLSAIDANPVTAGDQAFVFVATAGAAFTGVRGQLTFAFQDQSGTANDRTIVQADLNGDRIADFGIELIGLIPLTASDFIL